MAMSNSYSFNLNKTQIITRAFNLINVYDVNSTVNSDDYSFASDILNMMIKAWEAEGMNMWKRRQATLFPQYSQSNYQLGSVTGADYATNSYNATTSSASAASSATAISVTSATGFTASNYIGIQLDTGYMQWTTISSVAGTTINLNAALTSTVASGNTVVSFTTLINRPLGIVRATTYQSSNSTETTIQPIGFDEYFNFPNKTTLGTLPANFYYDRLLNNSLPYTGTFYVYPVPNNVSVFIKFTYQDSIQDMLNANDTPDFPQEWLGPLTWNLAAELAVPYGKVQELQVVQPKASLYKVSMHYFDSDDTSLTLGPDFSNFFLKT